MVITLRAHKRSRYEYDYRVIFNLDGSTDRMKLPLENITDMGTAAGVWVLLGCCLTHGKM